ncbi:MAG: DUF1554 domain-containing protein [Patescibacteria group bacterium]|nr:DUF1554 domain-containing protein [Patescibacteria group bacterium]
MDIKEKQILKIKLKAQAKSLAWRAITTVILTMTAVVTVWAYAAFVEPSAGPTDSDQDFAQNILGANNADNDFNSSSVAANADGSIIERQEYIQTQVDSNLDTLSPLEKLTKRVFVTSTTYNGNLGGVSGADDKCQTRADAAGLGGTWQAIISGDSITANSRIGYNWLFLVNMIGEPVATNFIATGTVSSLGPWTNRDGTNHLYYPIQYDEFGVSKTGCVWTGSTANGLLNTADDQCSDPPNSGPDWINSNAGYNGTEGRSNYTDSQWVKETIGCGNCSGSNSLYCIEQ